MRLRILDTARDDLVDGFNFYEESEQGVGDFFLANLYSDIESLKIYGGIHRRIYKRLHRSLSSRFPFAIYYTVEEDTVIVQAILDCRKNPSWIRTKIKSLSERST